MRYPSLVRLLFWAGCCLAQPCVSPVFSQIPERPKPGKWEEPSEGEKLFALTVLPALTAKCAACHGQNSDQIESGLDLSDRVGVLRGGDSGEAILVPGDHQKSWLYLSATWEHDALQMPPKENDRLDANALEALAQWIDAGAPWPGAERVDEIRGQFSDGVTVATSGGLDSTWNERRYDPDSLWAYQPLRIVEPPIATSSSATPVDAFIDARLNGLGLKAAPRATRRALIRRLYFDLTGLPPTPEQVQDFVQDPRPEKIAWAELVDEVLASPLQGEQWARHWLDIVRYADSAGFANDYERPNTWRYRDYVVRSFNQDRSLKDFFVQQIAGDEIEPENPKALIATGMLRMGPWEQTAMSVDRVTRQQFLDDVTDVIGQTFLAHPLQCARCHDHKFDPIPTRDFYRIQAVFATTQFVDRDAPFLAEENQSLFRQQQQFLNGRIGRFQKLQRELGAREIEAAKDWYAQRGLPYAPRDQKIKEGISDDKIAPRKVGFTPEEFGLERIARKYIERHRWELDRYRPIAFSVYSGPTPARKSVHARLRMPKTTRPVTQTGKGNPYFEKTAILTGGDPFSPSIPVSPGVFSVLTGIIHPANAKDAAAITPNPTGRRTEFARWLVDPNRNPLTPRVMANRIWQHHFGKGLVPTPNNFGTTASKPSHPDLLEFLAGELVRSDWSAKHLHRLLLTSDAYCRAQTGVSIQMLDEKDPLGNSYAIFGSRRLSAEEIRDGVLQISGLLNFEMGGVPIYPDFNAEVAAQPRQIMGTYAPVYQASALPKDRNRRTLYAIRLRGLRDPMLEVFNRPTPDLSCEARDSSTVAPQALTLFNSPFSYNRALAMAKRLLAETRSDPEIPSSQVNRFKVIRRAYLLTYGREPSPEEFSMCVEHWKAMQSQHRGIQLVDTLPPAEVTRTFVDENTGGQFSYTETLDRNQNYVPEVQSSKEDALTRGLADVCLVLLSSNELLYVP